MKAWLRQKNKEILFHRYEGLGAKKAFILLCVWAVFLGIALWIAPYLPPNFYNPRIDWREVFSFLVYFPVLETLAVFVWPALMLSVIVRDHAQDTTMAYSDKTQGRLALAGTLAIVVLFFELRTNPNEQMWLFALILAAQIFFGYIVSQKKESLRYIAFWLYAFFTCILFSRMHTTSIDWYPELFFAYPLVAAISIGIIIKTRGIALALLFHSFFNALYFVLRKFFEM